MDDMAINAIGPSLERARRVNGGATRTLQVATSQTIAGLHPEDDGSACPTTMLTLS